MLLYKQVMQNKMNSLIRLGNFLIDSVVIVIFIMFSSYLLKDVVSQEQMKIGGIIFYYVYYFVMEYALGQTIGKIFTKSKKDGSGLTYGEELYICLGYWYDNYLEKVGKLLDRENISYENALRYLSDNQNKI